MIMTGAANQKMGWCMQIRRKKLQKKTKETNVGKYLNNKGAWMFGLTDGGKEKKKRSPNHLLLSPNVSPGIHTGHYRHSDTDSHPCACVCPLLCSFL